MREYWLCAGLRVCGKKWWEFKATTGKINKVTNIIASRKQRDHLRKADALFWLRNQLYSDTINLIRKVFKDFISQCYIRNVGANGNVFAQALSYCIHTGVVHISTPLNI